MVSLKSGVILVVDDEPAVLESFIAILEDRFDVLVASSASEAIAIIEKENPWLAFVDIKLPDKSGLEVLKSVKKIRPDTIVVMETAYADLDDAMKSISLGASDYIIKPFGVSEVEDAIEAVSSRKPVPMGREDLMRRWNSGKRNLMSRAFSTYAFT